MRVEGYSSTSSSSCVLEISLIILVLVFLVAWAILLFRELSGAITLDVLIGPRGGIFWSVLATVALTFFAWEALSELVWRAPQVLGPQVVRPTLKSSIVYFLKLSALGGFSFWVASDQGLSGNLDTWHPRLDYAIWPRLWALGISTGLATAVFGLYAQKWIFLAQGIGAIGYRSLAYLLAFTPYLLLMATCILAAAVLSRTEGLTRLRFEIGLALLVAWAVPSHLTEIYLRKVWDYGPSSLAEAAQMPSVWQARRVGIVVLAGADGSKGTQYRENDIAAEGVDASYLSLSRLGLYLRSRNFRTLFLDQGLRAIRSGWALHWDSEQHLNACMLGLGVLPSINFLPFLKAIEQAPVTARNFQKLERMAHKALVSRFPRSDLAQKTYEGFSAAYAHFGDAELSIAWQQKVYDLWPWYSGSIRTQPVEAYQDGRLSGQLLVKESSPQRVKLGLFSVVSTSTKVNAHQGLVDSVYPSKNGFFQFSRLVPGEYYLALQADADYFSEGVRVEGAPGVLKLTAENRRLNISPIRLKSLHMH